MKRLIVFILAALLLAASAAAADVQGLQIDSFGLAGLEAAAPDAARDILGGGSLTENADFSLGLGNIIDASAKALPGLVSQALKRALTLVAIVMLCALAANFRETQLGSFPALYLNLAAALAITAVSVGSLKSFVGLGSDTINEILVFSKSLLPTMAAALAASGKTLAASSMYVATALFCDLFITLTDKILLPLVYVYITLSAADAAVGGDMLGRLAGLVKWLVTALLKTIILCFTAYLSITGVISGSADSVAVKAAKVALSGAVPVVGSIISDASETVLLSASILKNAVGVFGMLCVLAVCAAPFLNLGVHYLAYKACGALSSALGGGETKLIDALSSALGMILAMTAVCALLLLVSCVASMKAVTG